MKGGHVRPNASGSKARCGGPALCEVCAGELLQLRADQKAAVAEVIRTHVNPLGVACACGMKEWGASFSEHVADEVLSALGRVR